MNKVIVLSVLKTLLALFVISSGLIHLSPDEAQYWTWSRHLDFGYYSKPPGIAYQIAFGTFLFGASELGVRFGSLLIGFLMPILIYRLSKQAELSDEASFLASFIWCLTPLGFIGSIFAITDVGMILFWTCALVILLKEGVRVKFALSIACGALFKFPIYFLWPIALFFERPRLKWLSLIGVSLVGLVPTLIWNIQHDFVTFRHVGATLPGGTSALQSGGNFFSFIGSQIA
ncbi:MAG: ArnT family glycosyltransferase, partial [Parachlamydiaceae bacterium]